MADEHLISLQPGTVIDGRYEVVKCLGAGSMGLVYACRHRELSGHLVAVKVLFPEVSHDKIATARFRNEIFASYGVSHPNVVRAYEYIRDGDLVGYTMEYVGGGDLADRLGRSKGPIPVADVIRMLSQMCAGVQAIHDSGIVHRDLKPENILLSKDGNVKIADFGIARTGHGPKLTEHGGVVGTIDYVSPEYMLNSQVDWRSDIYAVGILAYEMLTGESPFKGDSVYATMTKRLKTDPDPPSKIREDCPAELDAIVLRAMERDPEARYQSAGAMFEDLQNLAQRLGFGAVLNEESGLKQERVSPRSQRKIADDILPDRGHVAVSQTVNSEQSPRRAAPLPSAHQHSTSDRDEGSVATKRPMFSQKYPSAALDDEIGENEKPTSFFKPARNAERPAVAGRENAVRNGAAHARTPRNPLRPPADMQHNSNMFSTAVDTDRMMKLHELVEQPAPWDLYDFLRLVLAILIGLGVGFLIVHHVSTGILGIRNSVGANEE